MKHNMKSLSARLDRDVVMEMRDGIKLRADIYRPADRRKHPAILIRTPYNKVCNAWHHNSFLHFIDATSTGYVVVIQDVRGRFASEGQWSGSDIFQHEGEDGYDSVEWIAAQPWCDGNVGMAGISALAGLQWMTAMENPPHLKAIAPGCGGLANIGLGMQPRRGSGVASPAVLLSSIPGNALEVAARLEREGKDAQQMRRDIAWVQSDPERAVYHLPLKDLPILRYEFLRNTWDRLTRPVSQAEQFSREKYERVTVPCLHQVGWYDGLEWAVIESYVNMRRRGGSALSKQCQHLIVGPWWHTEWGNFLGALNFGPTASLAGGMISQSNLAFYDRYLRGVDTKLPAVRYFLMGANIWCESDEWPLAETQWQRFYLHSRGHANTSNGDGTLSREEPQSESPDQFCYDPLIPVPSVGGRFFGTGLVPGPLDQSRIESRHDVLCYSTPVLESELEITGPLELRLYAATSATDTDFTAKLVDVYPDGTAYNLAEGIRRASRIQAVEKISPIIPGKIYEYVIPLGETSQLFRKGHRVRLEISSSNFPMFDRNMNTGRAIGEDALGVIAFQTIYHQSEYASYLELPVILSSSVTR
ncbi:MAG TPA: CocE/NonD family hydrolase [Dehalococcoidales bacterium]|nr:CocE/NonD family hydrolase [Dehalococcoidales bacterium]